LPYKYLKASTNIEMKKSYIITLRVIIGILVIAGAKVAAILTQKNPYKNALEAWRHHHILTAKIVLVSAASSTASRRIIKASVYTQTKCSKAAVLFEYYLKSWLRLKNARRSAICCLSIFFSSPVGIAEAFIARMD
jgi:hypothetical protein